MEHTMNHGQMEMDHQGHGAHTGHDHHAMMIADLRKRFWVVLALTVPLMALSPMIQHWMGIRLDFPGAGYVLTGLATLVFWYGGWPFLKGWYEEMKAWDPGMMTLIGFAITVAYGYSVATVLGLKGMDFFWELATLILVMLLGHWIEMRSVAAASRELELLVRLMPDEAHLVHGEHIMDVRTADLKQGDVVLIKPGEKIAADGVVVQGDSYVDESLLTGESRPVDKKKGDKVIAASLNGNGALRVEVSHAAKDSYLSQVVRLVEEAQRTRSKTQLLADKAARWLTLIAIVAGLATFLAWFLSGSGPAFAIERMVTVIVICCPHALGLAVPLVVARSTALSARNGLLIRNRTAFENARKITTIVFDKTGTLTIGKFEVVRTLVWAQGTSEQELLRLAAGLEQSSEHPIATGILRKAAALGVTPPAVEDFKALTGQGVEGRIDGRTVRVVGPGYLTQRGIPLPANFAATAGETGVFVLEDDTPAGYIALADQLRPESGEAISTLHDNGIKCVLLTGDNEAVAADVSKALGMDGYFAGVLPHEKQEKIKELQGKDQFVAMTGDGVNDAPALAQADIGIAVGSGSDIAAETAGIVLVNSNPLDVVRLILFGKATYRKMVQNLVWATGYNAVAMPLAAGVLYRAGILLSPAAGAALMSVSTVVVAVNAGLLNVKKPAV
ncbi:MAG: copper-translocating P-type ATPase [Bacteroidetes bacterium]|nr:copper-translocating P-type ATPase [Bacteroidota bacterium]